MLVIIVSLLLVCHRGSSEVKFSVNDRLAAASTVLSEEATAIPTDHIFTMTGIANQTMCVLSTESLPGIISADLSLSLSSVNK